MPATPILVSASGEHQAMHVKITFTTADTLDQGWQVKVYTNNSELATVDFANVVAESNGTYSVDIELTDGGNYTFAVTVFDGTTESSLSNVSSSTAVYFPPNPADNVTATVNKDTDTIEVSWTSSTSAGVSSHKITPIIPGDPNADPPTQDSLLISKAKTSIGSTVVFEAGSGESALGYGTYKFQVEAIITASIKSDPATSASAVTIMTTSSNYTTSISSLTVGDSQIAVSYTAPELAAGENVQSYRVRYREASGQYQYVDVLASDLTKTLTGLTNSTIYEVSVRAIVLSSDVAISTPWATVRQATPYASNSITETTISTVLNSMHDNNATAADRKAQFKSMIQALYDSQTSTSATTISLYNIAVLSDYVPSGSSATGAYALIPGVVGNVKHVSFNDITITDAKKQVYLLNGTYTTADNKPLIVSDSGVTLDGATVASGATVTIGNKSATLLGVGSAFFNISAAIDVVVDSKTETTIKLILSMKGDPATHPASLNAVRLTQSLAASQLAKDGTGEDVLWSSGGTDKYTYNASTGALLISDLVAGNTYGIRIIVNDGFEQVVTSETTTGTQPQMEIVEVIPTLTSIEVRFTYPTALTAGSNVKLYNNNSPLPGSYNVVTVIGSDGSQLSNNGSLVYKAEFSAPSNVVYRPAVAHIENFSGFVYGKSAVQTATYGRLVDPGELTMTPIDWTYLSKDVSGASVNSVAFTLSNGVQAPFTIRGLGSYGGDYYFKSINISSTSSASSPYYTYDGSQLTIYYGNLDQSVTAFRVSTLAGEGPTNLILPTKLNPPTAVSIVASAATGRALDVSWTAPTAGTTPNQYKVELYTTQDASGTPVKTVTVSSSTSTTISGSPLVASTQYYAFVRSSHTDTTTYEDSTATRSASSAQLSPPIGSTSWATVVGTGPTSRTSSSLTWKVHVPNSSDTINLQVQDDQWSKTLNINVQSVSGEPGYYYFVVSGMDQYANQSIKVYRSQDAVDPTTMSSEQITAKQLEWLTLSGMTKDDVPPTTITDLSASAVSSSEINLSWTSATDASPGVDHVEVHRKTGVSGTYSLVHTSTASVFAYGDTGLAASTTYYYKVKSVDADGNVSEFSNEASATTNQASLSSFEAALDSPASTISTLRFTLTPTPTSPITATWRTAYGSGSNTYTPVEVTDAGSGVFTMSTPVGMTAGNAYVVQFTDGTNTSTPTVNLLSAAADAANPTSSSQIKFKILPVGLSNLVLKHVGTELSAGDFQYSAGTGLVSIASINGTSLSANMAYTFEIVAANSVPLSYTVSTKKPLTGSVDLASARFVEIRITGISMGIPENYTITVTPVGSDVSANVMKTSIDTGMWRIGNPATEKGDTALNTMLADTPYTIKITDNAGAYEDVTLTATTKKEVPLAYDQLTTTTTAVVFTNEFPNDLANTNISLSSVTVGGLPVTPLPTKSISGSSITYTFDTALTAGATYKFKFTSSNSAYGDTIVSVLMQTVQSDAPWKIGAGTVNQLRGINKCTFRIVPDATYTGAGGPYLPQTMTCRVNTETTTDPTVEPGYNPANADNTTSLVDTSLNRITGVLCGVSYEFYGQSSTDPNAYAIATFTGLNANRYYHFVFIEGNIAANVAPSPSGQLQGTTISTHKYNLSATQVAPFKRTEASFTLTATTDDSITVVPPTNVNASLSGGLASSNTYASGLLKMTAPFNTLITYTATISAPDYENATAPVKYTSIGFRDISVVTTSGSNKLVYIESVVTGASLPSSPSIEYIPVVDGVDASGISMSGVYDSATGAIDVSALAAGEYNLRVSDTNAGTITSTNFIIAPSGGGGGGTDVSNNNTNGNPPPLGRDFMLESQTIFNVVQDTITSLKILVKPVASSPAEVPTTLTSVRRITTADVSSNTITTYQNGITGADKYTYSSVGNGVYLLSITGLTASSAEKDSDRRYYIAVDGIDSSGDFNETSIEVTLPRAYIEAPTLAVTDMSANSVDVFILPPMVPLGMTITGYQVGYAEIQNPMPAPVTYTYVDISGSMGIISGLTTGKGYQLVARAVYTPGPATTALSNIQYAYTPDATLPAIPDLSQFAASIKSGTAGATSSAQFMKNMIATKQANAGTDGVWEKVADSSSSVTTADFVGLMNKQSAIGNTTVYDKTYVSAPPMDALGNITGNAVILANQIINTSGAALLFLSDANATYKIKDASGTVIGKIETGTGSTFTVSSSNDNGLNYSSVTPDSNGIYTLGNKLYEFVATGSMYFKVIGTMGSTVDARPQTLRVQITETDAAGSPISSVTGWAANTSGTTSASGNVAGVYDSTTGIMEFRNLIPGTQYWMQFRSNGHADVNNVLGNTTIAPIVTATPVDATSVNLEWNGALLPSTSHTYSYSVDSGAYTPITPTISSDGITYTYQVTSLTTGTYTFVVKATSIADSTIQSMSDIVSATLVSTAPAITMPTSLSVGTAQTATVSVTGAPVNSVLVARLSTTGTISTSNLLSSTTRSAVTSTGDASVTLTYDATAGTPINLAAALISSTGGIIGPLSTTQKTALNPKPVLDTPKVMHVNGDLTTQQAIIGPKAYDAYLIQANAVANVASYAWEKSTDGNTWSAMGASGAIFTTDVSNGKVTLYLQTRQAHEGLYRLTGVATSGYTNPDPTTACNVIALTGPTNVTATGGNKSATVEWTPATKSTTHIAVANSTDITYRVAYNTGGNGGKVSAAVYTGRITGGTSSPRSTVINGLTAANNTHTFTVVADVASTDASMFLASAIASSMAANVTEKPDIARPNVQKNAQGVLINLSGNQTSNVFIKGAAVSGVTSFTWQFKADVSGSSFVDVSDAAFTATTDSSGNPCLEISTFGGSSTAWVGEYRLTGTVTGAGYQNPDPTSAVQVIKAATPVVTAAGGAGIIDASWNPITYIFSTNGATGTAKYNVQLFKYNAAKTASTSISPPGLETITATTKQYTSLLEGTYRLEVSAFNLSTDLVAIVSSGKVDVDNLVVTAPPTAICFLADAPVLTPAGYRPIATLRVGDKVRTATGRVVTVKRVFAKEYTAGPAVNPFVIPKGSFGALRALPISPNHEVMVAGRGMVKAKDLGLPRMKMTGSFTYYNLELEDWVRDNLVVAGVECESLAPASRITMTKAEFGRFVQARYGPQAAARLRTVCFEEVDGRVSMPAL